MCEEKKKYVSATLTVRFESEQVSNTLGVLYDLAELIEAKDGVEVTVTNAVVSPPSNTLVGTTYTGISTGGMGGSGGITAYR